MSTWWYYECLSHDPPLVSADEFTQHTKDRYFIRGVELIGERPVEADDSYWGIDHWATDERTGAYFNMNARRFLKDHPTCRIGLVNEYGERRGIEGQS